MRTPEQITDEILKIIEPFTTMVAKTSPGVIAELKDKIEDCVEKAQENQEAWIILDIFKGKMKCTCGPDDEKLGDTIFKFCNNCGKRIMK